MEQLDYVIEQLRRALERLSSNEALEELRGAIREYRNSEKRQKSVGRRNANERFRQADGLVAS